MHFLMVFDFTQFWLDGRPGNEYFWISHKISGLLTPLTPLGVHPQLFKTTVWNRYEQFLLQCATPLLTISLGRSQKQACVNKKSTPAITIFSKKTKPGNQPQSCHLQFLPYLFLTFMKLNYYHTGSNIILIVVARAISNFNKNHTVLICRI